MKSWKTTLAGVGGLLAVIGGIIKAVSAGNLAAIDWTASIAAITASVGLLFARDNNKSSEDVGANK